MLGDTTANAYILGGLITALFLFLGTVGAAYMTYKAASNARVSSASIENRKAKIDEVDQVLTGQSAYIKLLETRIAATEAQHKADYDELRVKWRHCEDDKDVLEGRVAQLEKMQRGT